MQLYNIGEQDMNVRSHPDFAEWLRIHVKNKHVRNELILASRDWVTDGEFSINTGRINHCFGGHACKTLRKAIEESPYIRLTKKAIHGQSSAKHEIVNLNGITTTKKQLTEIYPASFHLPPTFFLPRPSCSLVVDRDWLLLRSRLWLRWCSSRGLDPSVDHFGLTDLSKNIFQALEAIEFPISTAWLDLVAPVTGDLWLRRALWFYHWNGTYGSVLRRVKYVHGRTYHCLTTCPRVLRRLLTIDGERLAEADLGASYFSLLAGQMPAGGERDRLIKLLVSGRWYTWLESHGCVDVSVDPDAIKKEAQRQLLFGHDWRTASRPLWPAMTSEFPTLGTIIETTRKTHGGPSGLARHLSKLEGQVMRPAINQIHSMGVLALPLHDGILVGESSVDVAAEQIRQSCMNVLGYVPLVRAK